MKPNIPDNKKLVRAQIKALKITYNEYKYGKHVPNYDTCALCKVAGRSNLGYRKCFRCPWIWFTEDSCHMHIPVTITQEQFRMRQINDWIKALENHIKFR